MAAAPDPLIAWLLDELQPLAAQIGEIRARQAGEAQTIVV